MPTTQSLTRSKSDLRNILRFTLLTGMLASFITGCKKDSIRDIDTDPDQITPISLSDIIYFTVNGKVYTSNTVWSAGVGNSGVNMKFLDAPVTGMKSWGTVRGKSYYSPVDSIYFHYQKTFSNGNDNYKVSFGKGFHVRDMSYAGTMFFPKDIRSMLAKGEQKFATDYQSFNAIDGFWFASDRLGSTGVPEYSFEDPATYPQADAHFEITKKEQIDQNSYRIEARFEMNLYDAEHQKNRVTNGFLRLTVYREWWGTVLFN
ncbi:MAG: hypothetical protein V4594_05270 [Bacteroidota bacterium]